MKFKYETNRRASKSYHEIYFLTLNARGVIILAFFSYVYRLSMKLTLICIKLRSFISYECSILLLMLSYTSCKLYFFQRTSYKRLNVYTSMN